MIKYVDDASVTEEGKYPKSNTDGSIPTTDTSLQDDSDHCLHWSAKNKMGLNTKKTFEMLITSSQNQPVLPLIVINGETIHRVDTAKLLVYPKNLHGEHMYNPYILKQPSQLHSLRMLRRASLPPEHMISYYISKI